MDVHCVHVCALLPFPEFSLQPLIPFRISWVKFDLQQKDFRLSSNVECFFKVTLRKFSRVMKQS